MSNGHLREECYFFQTDRPNYHIAAQDITTVIHWYFHTSFFILPISLHRELSFCPLAETPILTEAIILCATIISREFVVSQDCYLNLFTQLSQPGWWYGQIGRWHWTWLCRLGFIFYNCNLSSYIAQLNCRECCGENTLYFLFYANHSWFI